ILIILTVSYIVAGVIHAGLVYGVDIEHPVDPFVQAINSMDTWQILSTILCAIALISVNFVVVFRSTRTKKNNFWSVLVKTLAVLILETLLIRIAYSAVHIGEQLTQAVGPFNNQEILTF